MEINGGTIYTDYEGDGFNSDGNIIISASDITVFSGNDNNRFIDVGDNHNMLTINGGNIFMAGGPMAIAVNPNSIQNSLWITGTIHITGEDKEI